MKNIFISLLSLLAIVGMTSCSNDNEEVTNVERKYVFDIKVDDGAQTRAIKSGWENGDEIYLFFGSCGNMIVIQYDGLLSKWDVAHQEINKPDAIKEDGTGVCFAIWANPSGSFYYSSEPVDVLNPDLGDIFYFTKSMYKATPEYMDNSAAPNSYTVTVSGSDYIISTTIRLEYPMDMTKLTIKGYSDDSYPLTLEPKNPGYVKWTIRKDAINREFVEGYNYYGAADGEGGIAYFVRNESDATEILLDMNYGDFKRRQIPSYYSFPGGKAVYVDWSEFY